MMDEGPGTERPGTSHSNQRKPLAGDPGTEQGVKPPNAQEAPTATPSGNGAPPPLDRAPLAYENSTFLNSADGRLIRIVSEYCEPLARFRREQLHGTVVFFRSPRVRGREVSDPAVGLL